jgi:hypothetical protein
VIIALCGSAVAARACAKLAAAVPDPTPAPADAAPEDAAPVDAEPTDAAPTDAAAAEPAPLKPLLEPAGGPTPRQAWARKYRWPILLTEYAVVFGPSLAHYWGNEGSQKEDWELHWDWKSWKEKLEFEAWVLDTNRFEANAIRHPLPGVLNYQIGRTNGFGVGYSTLMTFVASVLWELIAEFRENPSVNDVFANTASAVLIGEPLFQIGLIADRTPTIPRRILGFVTSPFHRIHKEFGFSFLPERHDELPDRLEIFAGGNALRYNGANQTPEGRLGLDLELVDDPEFLSPGEGTTPIGLAGWNKVYAEGRIGGATDRIFAGAIFQSLTTYVGYSHHANDEAGRGISELYVLGGGFDFFDRRLEHAWDNLAAFHVIMPRYGAWLRTVEADLVWEVGAAADLAMVESWARVGIEEIPKSSIVLSHNYYYAPGASAEARVRASYGLWMAEAKSAAYAFWSFDDHSHGGHGDPKNLRDQRWFNNLRIGARPWRNEVQIELYGDINLRRGTGDHLERQSTELAIGAEIRVAF